MRRSIVMLVLALLTAQANADEMSLFNRKVDDLVVLLKDNYAREYTAARRTYIDTDRVLALAFFSIEGFTGGNNHTQYLAIFRVRNEGTPTRKEDSTFQLLSYSPIGGKAWRSVDPDKFEFITTPAGETIRLTALTYATGDPACCPSLPGTITYRFDTRRRAQLLELPVDASTDR
ncbi:MAG: hypothetical protein QM808_09530 [Steroidobacteraceae bacterium]